MSGRSIIVGVLWVTLIAQSAAAETADWLTVDELGGAVRLDFFPISELRAPPLADADLRSVAWGETSALAAGAGGTAGLLAGDGAAVDGYTDIAPLGDEDILDVAWGTTEWLVVGTNGAFARVDADGSPGPARTLFAETDARVVAWGGTGFLVGGANGQAQRVTNQGLVTGSAFEPLGGSAVSAMASSGTHWLVGGSGSEVCFVTFDGSVDRCLTLSFDTVSAIAWNGTNWVVSGDAGLALTIASDDSTSDPIAVLDQTIVAISVSRTGDGALDGNALAVGRFGAVRKLDADGTPTTESQVALGGVIAHGTTWTGAGWLVVGDGGAVTGVSQTGVPDDAPAAFQLLTPETRVTTVEWNGTGWLAANHKLTQWISYDSGPAEVMHDTGISVSPDTRSMLSWNGTGWLFASSAGDFIILDARGATVDGVVPTTAFADGAAISAVAWNGTEWMIGGPGVIRRVDRDGDLADATVSVLDGTTVDAIAWTGTEWLVAGCGAIQRVRADGNPVLGDYAPVLDKKCVWDLEWNGTRFLAVGEGGRVQILSAIGSPEGGVSVAFGGHHARAAAWMGDHWVAVGDYGNAQQIGDDGTVVDPGANILGWPNAADIASTFLKPDNQSCTDFSECASLSCNTGRCCIGCVISGACYAPGESLEYLQCVICDPDVAIDDWSGDDGAPCDDEKFCTDGDTCNARGECVGGPTTDCSGLDDQCSEGICNAVTDQCERDPTRFNGESCSDGVFCNGEERCLAGECLPGSRPTCDHLDDDCVEGYCDLGTDQCQVDSTSLNGEDCEDDSFCNGSDQCQDGACVPFEDPIDCSHLTSECARGSCDEGARACVEVPFDVGEICRPGDCTGQVADPPGTCDSDGICLETDRIDCGDGIACLKGVCEFDCEGEGDCVLGAFCHPSGVCRPPNRPPAAIAGNDQSVSAGTTITLDGRASTDPDGDPITYSWRQADGPAGQLTDSDSAVAILTPPRIGTADTIYLELELTVTDFELDSQPDLVTITVTRNTEFEVPVAAITGPSEGGPGEIVLLDGRDSSDPDEDELSYRWSQTSGPAAVIDDPTASFIPFVVPEAAHDTIIEFLLVVSDDHANSLPATHQVRVDNPAVEGDAASDLGNETGIDPVTDGGLFNFDTGGYPETPPTSDPPSDCACSGTTAGVVRLEHGLFGLLIALWVTRKKKGPRP